MSPIFHLGVGKPAEAKADFEVGLSKLNMELNGGKTFPRIR